MTVTLDADPGTRIRAAAFAFLDRCTDHGNIPMRRYDLATFTFEGQRVPLMAPQQGIWKPRFFDAALSICTVFTPDYATAPYADMQGPDTYLRYKWRGTTPGHADNVGLRRAMQTRCPLIWFKGSARALYLAIYPVYLVAEEADQHQFVVALDAGSASLFQEQPTGELALVREYAERVAKVRLHQPIFRQRVLTAYASRCAICSLRHTRLLDAAHVIPDSAGGEPVVTNGIAMCKIHHAAYDVDIFGIDPDYKVGVRDDVLAEIDGPTLRYTLQEINGSKIRLPARMSARPDRELLDRRWKQFRSVA